jgi:hypothetical protein
LLIDASHKKWMVATLVLSVAAVAVYWGFDRGAPGGLTGGSAVGLWYGMIGSALMVYAGLLAALRKVPSWWWIGSRKVWLKGHIWLGLLSLALLLCHSGFSWGGVLTRILWVVYGLTLLTGAAGLLVQQFLPRMLTARVPSEAPYDQLPHIVEVLRGRADELLASVWSADIEATQMTMRGTQVGVGAKVQFQEFYEAQVRPFLTPRYSPSSLLAKPLPAETAFARLRALPGLANVTAQVDQLEVLCSERRQLAVQERLHRWLHGWLLVHIPLSMALLVFGVAHAVVTLYF